MSIAYKTYQPIDDTLLEEFLKQYPEMIFPKEATLFYKGQIPLTALILLEGEIVLKKNKQFYSLTPYTLLGANNLLQNKPCTFEAIVQPKTKVISIDKLSIKKILEQFPQIKNSIV
ncbi:MAG: cyclic nucleotide-binding domain-containing protein [Halobacteriovoraceae bacterium]|nr:cyclic nucleotide-binding domain-containing protein [Halobacteriovoraceae bacterium]MCB9093931.1 cyclic nucleotide-binding domain-containing protein [Halobacteriovoraceae bacterium]